MKRSIFSVALACVLIPVVTAAQVIEDEVRDWKGKGSRSKPFKATIVGVEGDEVLLRPPVAVKRVPLSKLSEEDQEFVKQWQVENKELAETIRKARLAKIFKGPLMPAFSEGLVTHKRKKLTPYEIEDPENLKYIAVYRMDHREEYNDTFLGILSSRYKRMKDRGNFELVIIMTVDNDETFMETLDRYKLELPVMNRKRSSNLGGSQALIDGLTKPSPVVPRLVMFDVNGKAVVDSYENEENQRATRQALKTMEKMVREAESAE